MTPQMFEPISLSTLVLAPGCVSQAFMKDGNKASDRPRMLRNSVDHFGATGYCLGWYFEHNL